MRSLLWSFGFFLSLQFISFQVFAEVNTAPSPDNGAEKKAVTIQDPKSNVFLGGLGIGVETGVIGVQYRRLLSPNWFLQASALVDLLGPGWGGGLGYQTDPRESECFWFFECQKRMRFSVSSLQYSGRSIDLSKSGETECEDGFCFSAGGQNGASYKASSSQAVSATIAWQDQFGSAFFYELQIGYWSMTRKPTFDYESGPTSVDDSKSLDELTRAHLALGFTTGFYF